MANPHLDGGQPWWPSTSSSTTQVAPPTGGNQVSPGHPGGEYQPDLNPPVVTQPLPPKDPNIIQEGIGSLGGSLHGDEIYQPEIKNTYDVLDAFTDLSKLHGQTSLPGAAGQNDLTKYGKSWAFNPNNPDNLIGNDTHTLGNMIMTSIDPETGKSIPILDSEGKPIFTSFGKSLYDHMHDEGFVGQNQSVHDSSSLEDYIKTFSFDELQDWERDYFDQNWYGGDWDQFLGQPYGGYPESASMTDPKWWQQTALSDITPTGFSDFQHMYGKEFGEERVASPHSWGIEPFSEMIIEGDY